MTALRVNLMKEEEMIYKIDEEQLHSWRNSLSTAWRYPKEQEGIHKILSRILEEIDLIFKEQRNDNNKNYT